MATIAAMSEQPLYLNPLHDSLVVTLSLMITAMIGLGANLNDPIQQILDARAALFSLEHVEGGRSSSLYLSSPVGYSEQPNFINAVVELQTTVSADCLLQDIQTIEASIGRQRVLGNQNAPRVIDLDLLLYNQDTINSDSLIVPHPRMHERLFVLVPMHELQPTMSLEGRGSLSEMIAALSSSTDQVLHRLRV